MTDEMKEAVKQYLKDNLSISVCVDIDWESYSDYKRVKVTSSLFLDGEVISTSDDSATLPSTD